MKKPLPPPSEAELSMVRPTRRALFGLFEDNFLPKVLFWPTLLGMLLAVTLIYFY